MTFNRFWTRIDKPAAEIRLANLDADTEFIELRWFTPQQLLEVEQIPGGREAFQALFKRRILPINL